MHALRSSSHLCSRSRGASSPPLGLLEASSTIGRSSSSHVSQVRLRASPWTRGTAGLGLQARSRHCRGIYAPGDRIVQANAKQATQKCDTLASETPPGQAGLDEDASQVGETRGPTPGEEEGRGMQLVKRIRDSPLVQQRAGLQRFVDEAMQLAHSIKADQQAGKGAFSADAVQQQMDMYRQGGVIFLRDVKRDGPLLCRLWWAGLLDFVESNPSQGTDSSSSGMTKGQVERAARLQADLLSVIPFAFIILNTVPLTPLVMPLLAKYVPRKFLMPSQFEEARLVPIQRLVSRQGQQRRASMPSLPSNKEAKD